MTVKKTPAKMADGRELFDFDDVTAEREVLPDTRDLPPASHGSTMRFDVLCSAPRQPTAHVVHDVSTVWRSHGRARKRYALAVRAPTGQICTVLPEK